MDDALTVNWDQVEEVRATVGAEEFPDLLGVFLDEVEDALARLGEPDAGPAAELLHFLKGCALNLGLSGFAAICAQGERAARDGEADRIDPAHFRRAWGEVRRFFLSEVGRRFAA